MQTRMRIDEKQKLECSIIAVLVVYLKLEKQ